MWKIMRGETYKAPPPFPQNWGVFLPWQKKTKKKIRILWTILPTEAKNMADRTQKSPPTKRFLSTHEK